MAYRELEFGDLVRIASKNSPFHGRDAVVIDEDNARIFGKIYKVQIKNGRGVDNDTSTVIAWFKDKELLVRDSSYEHIVDGRVDHEAKQAFEYKMQQQRIRNYRDYREDRQQDLEPCGTCSCCEAHNRS